VGFFAASFDSSCAIGNEKEWGGGVGWGGEGGWRERKVNEKVTVKVTVKDEERDKDVLKYERDLQC
jgi:hypothetical protein